MKISWRWATSVDASANWIGMTLICSWYVETSIWEMIVISRRMFDELSVRINVLVGAYAMRFASFEISERSVFWTASAFT